MRHYSAGLTQSKMATHNEETQPEYVRRMADDGGGGLASLPDVESAIAASFAELATVVTDPASLPVTTSIRPAGAFVDADDLADYLESGGLVVTDSSGNYEPIGFVWLLKTFNEMLQEYVWQVYIDSVS